MDTVTIRESPNLRKNDPESPSVDEASGKQNEMAAEKTKPKVGNFFHRLWTDKKKRPLLLLPALLLVGALASWVYVLMTTESTDDAFVSSHVHTVGSRIAGTVIELAVKDNQLVKKGDLLVRLDPKDFAIQQKVAQANVLKAQANLHRWDGGYLHPNEVLQKSLDAADALTADAMLEQATLNLQYIEVRASVDGKIGNRAVETGQQVAPGQALMALVERTPWVIANFKESQAARLHPGQKSEISVDAISGHKFTGQIDSIAPGSGATFSLLPPDNATGNFTKIVQRIPVKITFDADSLRGFEDRLTTGMSTQVKVQH